MEIGLLLDKAWCSLAEIWLFSDQKQNVMSQDKSLKRTEFSKIPAFSLYHLNSLV